MKPRIRIIKHTDQRPKESELDRIEQCGRQSTREITTTIKLWVNEFKERRRIDEQYSRSIYNGIPTAISIEQSFQVAGSGKRGGACVREWVDLEPEGFGRKSTHSP
jgi:hypothetical protein